MAWSWRTIFLLIRGIDQTGRAFEGPKRQLTELQKRQKALARSSYRLLFAGAAFLAFGIMSAKALSGLWQLTSKGRLAADDLGRAWKRLATGVAESITTIMGPAIKGLTKWLDNVASNKAWTGLLAMLGVGVVGGAITGGALALGGAAAGGIAGLLFKLGIGGGGAAVAGGGLTAMYEHLLAGGSAATLAGGAAGGGIKAAIIGKLTGMFAAIKGAVVTLGAGGMLAIAIPVIITLGIAYLFSRMSQEKKVELGLLAGEELANLRGQFGLDEGAHYSEQSRTMWGIYGQGGQNIDIDIYDNQFPLDIESEELARELGYIIYDEYSNQEGATCPNH